MKNVKIYCLIVFLTIIFVAAAYLTYTLAEPKIYDFMMDNSVTKDWGIKGIKQVHGSDNIVLVVIDDKSVEKYRWPWSRDKYCDIINYFEHYTKAKVVILDMLIGSFDTNHPNADKKFFNTLKNKNNIIVGFMPNFSEWEDKIFGKKYDKTFITKFGVKNITDKTTDIESVYKSLLTSPEEYINAISNTGSVIMFPGALQHNDYIGDDVFRTHEYISKYKDGYLPSLALKTFLMVNNYPQMIISNNYIEFPTLNKKIKIYNHENHLLNYTKYYQFYNTGYTHHNYSAIDIMQSYIQLQQGKKPIINPEEFKNKIIFIGGNVTGGDGLNDNKNSPIATHHPGVDIQATATDNILNNDFLFVLPIWFNCIITILGMLLVYFAIKISNLTRAILSTLSIILGYIFVGTVCFYFGIVINIITPIVMFVLTTILAYTHKFVIENRHKEKVKAAMGKYISEDVMKRVIQNIDHLGLGGKKATVTVLFSDIRGFTTISEQMSAQQVSQMLNEYFSEMEPVITQYNGIINKFIGDAVMAVFGEPIQDDYHAQNAVKCACDMLKKVQELQKKWVTEGKPKIEIGIGINTGEVFVGNIGSNKRMEYTVIGDTVNLASRLESYNKTYKTKMLISSTTYEEVKDIVEANKISDVQIRGKVNKVDIYEVVGLNS